MVSMGLGRRRLRQPRQLSTNSESWFPGRKIFCSFNQMCTYLYTCISDVFRLAREELEDRYLRIMEENVVIKKHAGKQASQVK